MADAKGVVDRLAIEIAELSKARAIAETDRVEAIQQLEEARARVEFLEGEVETLGKRLRGEEEE